AAQEQHRLARLAAEHRRAARLEAEKAARQVAELARRLGELAQRRGDLPRLRAQHRVEDRARVLDLLVLLVDERLVTLDRFAREAQLLLEVGATRERLLVRELRAGALAVAQRVLAGAEQDHAPRRRRDRRLVAGVLRRNGA